MITSGDMKITILLSTYNGAKYLREQLDSLYSQTLIDKIDFLVRDDGSTDGTQDILNEYQAKNKNFKWYQGENKRPARSFWELLNKASDSDYYAFSDQDDVWDKDKIEIAIKQLEQLDSKKPLLYMSDVHVVDANLNHLADGFVDTNVPVNYACSLSNSVCPGCTFVFNEEARKLATRFNAEEYIDHHDWTLYKIVICFGEVIFDKTTHMNYRQHENNVIGAKSKLGKYWDMIFKKPKDPKFIHQRLRNAQALEKYYGELMNEENKYLTHLVAHYTEDKKIKKALLKEKRFKYSKMQFAYLKYLVRRNIL